MHPKKYANNLPERSKLIGWVEFVELTEAHPTRIGELIEIGWIEPTTTAEENYLFQARDVYRMRKLMRLIRDLDVNDAGACIIVDLLERIEQLEKKVRDLERLL